MTMFHISPVAIELLMHSHVSNQPFTNCRSEFLRNGAINYCFEKDLLKLNDKNPEIFDTTDKGRALIRMMTQIDVDDFLGDFQAQKQLQQVRKQEGLGPFTTVDPSLLLMNDSSEPPIPPDQGPFVTESIHIKAKHGLNEHEQMMQKRREDREAETRGEIPRPSNHPMLGS